MRASAFPATRRLPAGGSRRLGALLAIAGALGCYRYVPTTIEAVPVGAPIRGLLSTSAQIALRDSLGLDVARLNGTLVERDGDRVIVAVRAPGTRLGPGERPLYQRFAVAERDVLRVDVRRLDKVRTYSVIAGTAGLVVWFVVDRLVGGPGRSDGGNGGPSERRVPWD